MERCNRLAVETQQLTRSKTSEANLRNRGHLVGGFNPSEKYARQIGNLPQIGVKIQTYLKPPPIVTLLPTRKSLKISIYLHICIL